MTTSPLPSRRAVLLAGTAGGVGVAVLGACSSGAKGTAPSGTVPSRTVASGSAAASPLTGASTPAATATGTTSAAGHVDGLVKLTDIPIGEAVAVTLPGGKSAVVGRPTTTTAAAFSAICTHQGCTVAPRGTQLHCPCHGSIYNAVTGAVILSANGGTNPGQAPLAKIAVHVDNGEVLAGPS